MAELKTNKEYEWFLQTFKTEKRAGGLRFKMVWAGVDTEYEIVEWPAIGEKNQPGPRLIELMQRLNGGGLPDAEPPDPFKFFRRGMHLFAKVQKHWTEGKGDPILYEFDYNTISPTSARQEKTIDPALKKRVLFRAGQSTTLTDLRERIKANDPALIPVLDEMVKTGEVKFP